MSEERCKHQVYLAHRCRDCEQEVTTEEVKIFDLEYRVTELEEYNLELKTLLKGATSSDQLLHARIKSLEMDKKQLDGLANDYLNILESIGYLPPDSSLALVKDIVHTKLRSML